MLKADTRRAFGKWLFLSALGFFLSCCFDSFYDIMDPQSNAMMTYLFMGALTPVYAFSSVFACVPFSTGFAKDVYSGLAVPMRIRCGKKRFLLSKLLCCCLSGGLALALGILLFILLVNLRLSHDYSEVIQIISDTTCYDTSAGFGFIPLSRFYGKMILMEFLSGMFYSAIGLVASVFIRNTSLILCLVFVVYNLLSEIAGYVPQWLVPCYLQIGSVGLSLAGTALAGAAVLGGGTILLCIIFYICASFKMRRV